MRISTLHLYQQGLLALQDQQAKLQQTELQLTSGLRFNKPSEDPSSAVKVLDLNGKIEIVDQYSRNIAAAQTSLVFEESIIGSVQNNLQRIRELVIQGINDSNSSTDRQSISHEIYQRLDELIDLANSKDALGDYIFAGFKVGSAPFVESGGSVSYQGDQGQLMLKIGDGAQVAVKDSGQEVFQKIPTGDGQIQIVVDPSNTGTAVVGNFGVNGSFIQDVYTLTFTQALPADPVTYTVTDSASGVIATGTYEEGDSISFAGAQLNLSGTPADGDSIVVSASINKDIFSTVKAIADALAGVSPDATGNTAFHNLMNQELANLDQGLEKMNTVRAGIGARLNSIDTVDDINQDFKLQLQTTLSETQDLDFAEAIARFNLQLTALQAAQQAYLRTTGLTLFQYL